MGANQNDFLRRVSAGAGLLRAAVDPTQGRGIWGIGRDLIQEAQRRPLTTLTPLGAPEGYRAGTRLKEDGHPVLGTGLQLLSVADGMAGGFGGGLLARAGHRGLRGMGTAGHALNPRIPGLPSPPEQLSGRMVPGHHYSNRIGSPEITHLDPSKAGTGLPGAEMRRDRRATNVYFPEKPGGGPRHPEPQFGHMPRYDLEYPEELILTDPKDIGKFVEEARARIRTGEADGYLGDVIEDLMEEAGYRGWSSGGLGRVFGHTELPGRLNARIVRDAKANNGITIDPRTGEDLGGQDLYSVAVHKGDDKEIFGDLTEDHIAEFRRDFADDLAKPGHQIGGWFDPETNRWVLDVAETHADRAAAEAAGRERGQDAIFHLGSFETIPLKAPNAPVVDQAGRSFFDPAALARAEEAAASYKSRDRVIDMPIRDFLSLAEEGISAEKAGGVDALLEAGAPFNDIPYLGFELGEGGARVTGHEGRHRARALQARGVETMPVVLRGPIRWDQQSGGFDQLKGDWPAVLRGESGGEVPFPVQDPRPTPDFMDPAARAARAAEQGFTTPAFHGTQALDDFQEFRPWSHFGTPEAANQRLDNRRRNPFELERLEGEAAGAGTVLAPRVMPTQLRGNFLETRDFAEQPVDIWDLAVRQGIPLGERPPELRNYASNPAEERAQREILEKALEPHGITGTRYRNDVEDKGSESFIVFDPKNVRSRAAAFDPRRTDSRNILAGITGLLGAGTVLRPEGGGR